jgi:hypothetical protein
MTRAQRLRFVTVPAFVPRFVPPGFSAWGAPDVIDLDDVASDLGGGTGSVAPSLRSQAPPAGYTARECDPFAALAMGDRCVLWGTTPSGIAVRIARDEIAADGLGTNPTAFVDGTVVSLLYGHNHRYVGPRITRADVLRIFDSLRADNTPATG